jgi:hypothetical protein
LSVVQSCLDRQALAANGGVAAGLWRSSKPEAFGQRLAEHAPAGQTIDRHVLAYGA